MVNNGFPVFPKVGNMVKFNSMWSFTDEFGCYYTVNQNTIGEILDTQVIDGMSYDVAKGYLIFIGLIINSKMHIIKFPYSDRMDVLTILPNTAAAQVLFGRR